MAPLRGSSAPGGDGATVAGQVAVVIAAAGAGTRLGRNQPKALVLLAGESLVVHAVRGVIDSGVVDHVIVTAPAERMDDINDALTAADLQAEVVPGGASRQESVAAGLAALRPNDEIVLIHDAARCLVPASVIQDVVSQVRAGHPAVVPGVPVSDTLRTVVPHGDAQLGAGVVDRDEVRAMQTPQGFTRGLIERAHRLAAYDKQLRVTDDAALVESLGVPVRIIAGDPLAVKITTELDLLLAEAIVTKAAE